MSTDDLAGRVAGARRHIQLGWSPARGQQIISGLPGLRRRRAALRSAGAALLLLVAGLAAERVRRPGSPPPALTEQLPRGGPPAAPPSSQVATGPARPAARAALAGPQVAVTPSPVTSQRPPVAPQEGAHPVANPPAAVALAKGTRPRASDGLRAPRVAGASWRSLALDGRFDDAYSALAAAAGPPAEDPDDLLLLADVARLSRHPEGAVAPLRRLLERHAADKRAAVAAFTLGRVLLDELGRPREAAAAFERARALDGEGLLCEDALARAVEAWARAGDDPRARAGAEEYLRLYPGGRRRRSVARHGGVD